MNINNQLSLLLIYLPVFCGNLIDCSKSCKSITDEPIFKSEHHLVTVDIKNCSNNSQVICDYNPSDDSSIFTPNQGYLISKVTKRDKVLWDSKDYGDQYGSQVFVGVGEAGNRVFRVYFPQPLRPEHLVPARPLEPDSTKPRLVTLDIRNKKSSHEVEYEYDQQRQTHTFTPNKGYLIHDVMRKDKLMWECEDGVYPEKVIILLDENNKPVLRFKFPKVDTPEEPFETDHRLIDLDVDNTRPNPLYSIKYEGDYYDYCVVFNVKSVYKFKSVNIGTKTVWRARDESECAYEVIFIHIPGLEQRLTLVFGDGSTKRFIKSYLSVLSGKWKEF